MSGPSAEDLRARIAEALTAWSCTVAGVPDTSKLMPQHREAVEQNSAARAEVVMAVVQPELDAKDAEIGRLAEENTTLVGQLADQRATLKRLTDLTSQYADRAIENGQRAEQLAAELEQWRACFGETALKDARGVLAERDRLRAAVERVRKYADEIETWDYLDGIVGSSVAADIEAALDQAPAAEQNGGGQ